MSITPEAREQITEEIEELIKMQSELRFALSWEWCAGALYALEWALDVIDGYENEEEN